MDTSDIFQIAANTSTTSSVSDQDFFYQCWILPSCETCLSSKYPCSWCTTSQVCVPNNNFRYPFALLAPIKYENICPLAWRERWEMRAKPFSCRCSTMTLVSVVVAVLSTLVGVLLIWLLTLLGKWAQRKWKSRRSGWWRFWKWQPWGPVLPISWKRKRVQEVPTAIDQEREPLLEHTG